MVLYSLCSNLGISTHTPREGCDANFGDVRTQRMIFQLTHPARGATV